MGRTRWQAQHTSVASLWYTMQCLERVFGFRSLMTSSSPHWGHFVGVSLMLLASSVVSSLALAVRTDDLQRRHEGKERMQ